MGLNNLIPSDWLRLEALCQEKNCEVGMDFDLRNLLNRRNRCIDT
jgi:hypothetical protein